MPVTAVNSPSPQVIEALPPEAPAQISVKTITMTPIELIGRLAAGNKISPQDWNRILDDANAVILLMARSQPLLDYAVNKVNRQSEKVARADIEVHASRALFLLLSEYDPNKQPFPMFLRNRLPLRTIDQIRQEGADVHRQRRLDRHLPRPDDRLDSNGNRIIFHARPSPVATSLDKPSLEHYEGTLGDLIACRHDISSDVETRDRADHIKLAARQLPLSMRKIFEYVHERQVPQKVAGLILGRSEPYISKAIRDVNAALAKSNEPNVELAPATKDTRLGLDVLLREAEAFPKKQYSWSDLYDFISTPQELVKLSRSGNPSLKRVWSNLSPTGVFGPELWSTNQDAFQFARDLLSRTFTNLDEVVFVPGLAAMLGCAANSRRGEFIHDAELARAAIRTGLMSPFRPAGHPVSRSAGNPSRYHLESVVQEAAHRANLFSFCQENFPNIDCLSKELGLSHYVRGLIMHPELETVPREIQNKITIDQVSERMLAMGVFGPHIPEGHKIPVDRLSGYFFSPKIPEEIRAQNFERWIDEHLPRLDDVKTPMLFWMSRYLGGDYNRTELMAILVERSYVSGKVPQHYPLTMGTSVTAYFRPEVVGAELARKNLHAYLRYSYQSAAEIRAGSETRSLFKLLGAKRLVDVVAYCDKHSVFNELS